MKRPMFNFFAILLMSALVLSESSCAQPNASIANAGKAASTTFPVNKTAQEWRGILTPEQFDVLINKGTERPYSGQLLHNDKTGDYVCAACGNLLFKSDAKFDSHCGWPSFDKAVEGGQVVSRKDHSYGMERTEVLCARCGGHLGHVFEDGPTKTGMRYCINSASLGFVAADKAAKTDLPATDTIVLAGGCFWSMQAIYQQLKGVSSVVVGYSGGTMPHPGYDDVSTGNTGYAEAAQIIYNPNTIRLVDILKVFFSVHNPTTLNKQGADEGTQYRSAIFYNKAQQKTTAEQVIQSLQANHAYDQPIVTAVSPFLGFYKAEEYHQDFYNHNKTQGYCRAVVAPKVKQFEKAFKDLLK